MKQQHKKSIKPSNLRDKAEELAKKNPSKATDIHSEYETLKLIHELEVHQIELELMNEELKKSVELNETTSQKYTELYNFAPLGFFTLTREGQIIELNFTGSQILEREYAKLKGSLFGFFVTDDTKSIFNQFLNNIFEKNARATCEIKLQADDNTIIYVYLTGIITRNENHCVVIVTDIKEGKQKERLLNKSEERNRSLVLQAAMDGFWLIDLQGNLLEVNDTYCLLSGYTERELLTMNISDFEISKTEYDTEFRVQKIMAQGQTRFETKHRRKDGSIFDVEINVKYLPIKDGRFVVFIHDITKRKKAEVELRQSEERYKSFFQGNHSVMMLIDPTTGDIKDANPAAVNYYGWTHSEICRKNISEINTLSKYEVLEEMQNAKNEKRYHFYFKHRLSSGEIRDVEVYSGPVKYSGSTLLYSIIQDITEQKLAKETLIESEQRYRVLFEKSNNAIFLTDFSTGMYVDCNHTAETLTGYAREELLKMKKGSLLPPQRKEEIAKNIELLNLGKSLRSETEITTREGKLIPVEFSASVVAINKKQFILSLLSDISKRKYAEEALKKSEEKVKSKLKTILSPEGSIANLELNDIIDAPMIQNLMDSFYELVKVPMAIIDIRGNILVGIGWQEICTKFHRVHPKACRNCFESDVHLTKGIVDGEFRLYKCKNNMWDMATPLMIGGEHKGNLYIGQIFFDDEPIDYNLFRKQAKKYSFDEQEYIKALEKVPRVSKQKIDQTKAFFLNLSRAISQLSYSNIKLARVSEQQKKVENELREKEDLLNKAQEIAHLGSWSIDHATKKLTWSNEMFHILGLQRTEIPATYVGFLDRIHPDEKEALVLLYTNSISKGDNGFEVEHRIIRKNSGEIRFIYEKCRHIKDDSGKIIRSVGMFHDITEQKEAADLIKENERLLRESQAIGHIASYSVDLIKETWKASPEMFKIFGIDESYPNTLAGWADRVHPDFRAELNFELFQENAERTHFEHEYKIIRFNDQQERWVHGHGKIEFDNNQKKIGLIGTVQDITKRKQAEEALKKLNEELDDRVKERTAELLEFNIALQLAEEKYRTIANYTFDWESWIDPDGNFIYVSPSCLRISGYSIDEFMNDPHLIFKIAHPEDREMVENYFFEGLTGNLPYISFDYRIITRNGEEKWIAHTCNSVFNNMGKWLGMRCSNSDITVRKKVESDLMSSQKKLRELTQYLNKITEEERTRIAREIHDELGHLLTVLKYDLEGLFNNSEKTVEMVKGNLWEMIGMVDSLSDSVRKIASDLRPAILDHLGLFPAIEWQIKQFRILTKIKCEFVSHEMDITFNKNESITIFRILQEVLTNIARHSKATKMVVAITRENKVFIMKITDNGVGFDLTERIQTVSLGLLGMQERALSIDGELQIESAPGVGTSVTLLLNTKH